MHFLRLIDDYVHEMVDEVKYWCTNTNIIYLE